MDEFETPWLKESSSPCFGALLLFDEVLPLSNGLKSSCWISFLFFVRFLVKFLRFGAFL